MTDQSAGANSGAQTGGGKISRRKMLGLTGGVVGVGALAGAGAIGYAWPRTTAPSSSTSATAVAKATPRYRSRPDLDPPDIRVTSLGAPESGSVFLTPSIVPGARGIDEKAALAAGLGQEGAMIISPTGELIWFLPTSELATNLRVQTYKGKPVLTYWTGNLVAGIGKGVGYILDSSYKTIATVHAGNGLEADLHDFTLTPSGTALLTAYSAKSMDLTSVKGPKKGIVQECVVQEIDVATGKVLFQWNSLDHVPLTESEAAPIGTAPYDYFHLNSVELDGPDHLIISARNTWTLYQLDRKTGAVTWRLGGKKSDFTMGTGTKFAWQHHATRLADGSISLFDDGAAPAVETQSRALILKPDTTAKTVSLTRAYTHPSRLLAQFEGSAQLLPNGNMFVGWGGEPYFSEFDTTGKLVLDGRFRTNEQSYRAFRMPWSGQPTGAPAIAVEQDSVGGYTVYASWNGATDIATWDVLAGNSEAGLTSVGSAPFGGFETMITARTTDKYFAVVALDASGNRLGVSKMIKR